MGTGDKARSAQLDSFVDLKAEGRTVFKVFARSAAEASTASGASAGLKNAWTWVGNACASSDDGHEAVQVQQVKPIDFVGLRFRQDVISAIRYLDPDLLSYHELC